MNAKITGLMVKDFPPRGDGLRVLAYFDVQLGDVVAIHGCVLARRKNGHAIIWFPRVDPVYGHSRGIEVLCPDVRAGILREALDAYRHFGGTESFVASIVSGAEDAA